MARALEDGAARSRDQPDVVGRRPGHDVIHVRLAGHDQRRRRHAVAIGLRRDRVDHPRAGGHRRQRRRRGHQHAQGLEPEGPPRSPVGERGQQLGPKPPGRLSQEQRPKHPRPAGVRQVTRSQVPCRPRRRHQDERRRSSSRRCGKPEGHSAAERHATNDRAIDLPLVERARDLLGVLVDRVAAQ